MTDELNKPNRGTGDWDIPLNENFDTLEAAARAFLPRGTASDIDVGGVITPEISANNQVTFKSDASLDSNIITDAGHDEVDLPQVRNLSVVDFESGRIGDSFDTRTSGSSGVVEVQDSVVRDGEFALRVFDTGASDSGSVINSLDGLDSYIQRGDSFSFKIRYESTQNFQATFSFCVKKPDRTAFGLPTTGYSIRLTSSGSFSIAKSRNNSILKEVNGSFSVSNNRDEWLRVDATISKDGEIFASLFDDTTDEKVAEVSLNDKEFDSGGIEIGAFETESGTGSKAVYFDSIALTRRTPEYYSETKKGITELGNEVTPSGSINTGPQEVPPDHPNYPVINLPVTDEASQGDNVGYHLAIDEAKAITIEAEADGNGGTQREQIITHLPQSDIRFNTGVVESTEILDIGLGASQTIDVEFTDITGRDFAGQIIVSVGQSQRQSSAIFSVTHFNSNNQTSTKVSEDDLNGFIRFDDVFMNSSNNLVVRVTETTGNSRNGFDVRVTQMGNDIS
jgi:hypothetical protein